MATCNIDTLLESGKCFACLTPGQLDIIELQLLCEILAAGGGGGGGSQTPWTSDIDAANFNLNNLGLINGVKVYRALLTQSGTDNPEVLELENSIGNIVWTRRESGLYDCTLAGAFPGLKTIYHIEIADFGDGTYYFNKGEFSIPNSLAVAAPGGDSTLNSWVEILVYP